MPAPDWTGRLQRIVHFCGTQGLDAVVVSAPANLRYLTGFTGSSALLICGAGGHRFLTDGRYEASVRDAQRDGAFAAIETERIEATYELTLGPSLVRLGARRVGFEASHVTVATLARWRGAADSIEWLPTDGAVEHCRLVKDATELAIFRRAGSALAGVAKALGAIVTADQTEREAARAIDRAIERAGFERPAFDTIVASGPNGAYPHARPTDRRFRPGDLVVLDFGGVLEGYCVDLTRVVGIGQIGSAAVSLYDAVREAQEAAIESVRAGVAGSDVDRAAREVLESRGLGPAFLHGTGHGLGLEVHEAPRLARRDAAAQDVLEAGMVCTVEPGAYVEGLGGVRLEDDVLVTIGGSEVLTEAPRDLLIV